MGVIGPEIVTSRFRGFAKDAGLPRIRLHDLRHSWATLALEAGLSPKVVMERLSHSNITTTLAIYSHTSDAIHRAAAEQLSGLMFGDPTAGAGAGN